MHYKTKPRENKQELWFSNYLCYDLRILKTKDALRRLFLFLARGVEGIRTPE